MPLLHILGLIGSAASVIVFAMIGATAMRDDRIAGCACLVIAFLQVVSVAAHFGGLV